MKRLEDVVAIKAASVMAIILAGVLGESAADEP